jgi:hypothetical protein
VGLVIVTAGRVVSAVGAEYVTVSESAPVLPAASRAVSVITLVPICSPIDDTLQFVVPDAVPPPPLLFDQLSDVTPTLSAAVPPICRLELDDVKDSPVVGVAIETVGRVVSEEVVVVPTDHVKVTVCDCRTPSNTRPVTVYVPAVVGVPEMNPVAEPTKSPGGIPVAV